MEDDVPPEDKKARLGAIEELQASVQAEINAALEGQTVEVLVEGVKRGKAHGRNRNDKLVYVEDAEDRVGEVVNVEVHDTSPWSLRGTVAAVAQRA